MALLGFGGFGSTKGRQVVDNAVGPATGGVAKHKSRKYRQYMNRQGDAYLVPGTSLSLLPDHLTINPVFLTLHDRWIQSSAAENGLE